MTAEEIRNWREQDGLRCKFPSMEKILLEIAAQLADANEEARKAREVQKQYQDLLLGKQTELQDHLRGTMPQAVPMDLPDIGSIIDTPIGKLLVVEVEHNGQKQKGVRPISEQEAEQLSKPALKQ